MLKHIDMFKNDANLLCFLASIVQNNVCDSISKETARFFTGLFQKKTDKDDTHTHTVRKLNVNYNKIYDCEIVSIEKILVCL